MRDQELKDALRAAKRLKYILAFVVLVSVLLLNQYAPTIPVAWLEDMRTALLGSTITGVIVALFYDLFIARQQEAQSTLDRELFASKVASELLRERAAELLTADDIKKVVADFPDKDGLVKALSALVVSDKRLQPHVARSYLRPMKERPRFHRLTATHKFERNNSDTYLWRCKHSVTSFDPDVNFRLFVCEDKQIAADITNAGGAADFVMFLSEGPESGLTAWDISKVHFSAENFVDAKRTRIELDVIEDNSGLKGLIGREIPSSEGRLFTVRTKHQCAEPTLTMNTEQLLSFNDPFFCWTSEDFCFVDHVFVDYSEVLEEFGDVTVLNYIGSQSGSLVHDSDRGVVEMKVNDLVGPGDGFVIIMRRKYCGKAPL